MPNCKKLKSLKKERVTPIPKEGYMAKTIKEAFPDLADYTSKNKEYLRAKQVVLRALNSKETRGRPKWGSRKLHSAQPRVRHLRPPLLIKCDITFICYRMFITLYLYGYVHNFYIGMDFCVYLNWK